MTDSPEEGDHLLNKIDKLLFPESEHLDSTAIKKFREDYKDTLEEREKKTSEVKVDELNQLYNHFCRFSIIQLIDIVSTLISETTEDANKFKLDMIKNFVAQYKTSIYRGFELHELKQQDTKLFEVLGQDLINRDNTQTRAKLTKIVDAFEEHIKNSLLADVNLEAKDEDEDKDDSDEGPFDSEDT